MFRPKNIVLLGPSHFKFFTNQCGLSKFSSVETPLGDLKIDSEVALKLESKNSNLFTTLSSNDDLREHSLEMQFPFLYKLFNSENVRLIPIQVGKFSDPSKRREAAKIINEVIHDDSSETLFIVSSDFCHYGARFDYFPELSNGEHSINEKISIMDKEGLRAFNDSDPIKAFASYLKSTENTICGQEAILLLLEILKQTHIKGQWSLIDYAQSNNLTSTNDSFVSYLAASFEVENSVNRD